jgi:hypothetical protein
MQEDDRRGAGSAKTIDFSQQNGSKAEQFGESAPQIALGIG